MIIRGLGLLFSVFLFLAGGEDLSREGLSEIWIFSVARKGRDMRDDGSVCRASISDALINTPCIMSVWIFFLSSGGITRVVRA